MAELLVAMAITALIVMAAGLYLRPMEAPLVSGVALLEGCVQRARAEAVAATSAYRLSPRGAARIAAEVGDSCATTTWADDPKVSVQLPEDVRMTDTTWSLCIDARGLPGTNLTITLNHPDYGSRAVEIMLGGATRTLP